MKSGKTVDSGATTIKKMETRDHEELVTEKEIARDGMLSRARTGWRVKATGIAGWEAAVMDKVVRDSNNHGSEVKRYKTVSKRVRGTSGDGIVVLQGATTGTEIGFQRQSKIPSGWTPQKWKSQIKSIPKKTSRSGRSA